MNERTTLAVEGMDRGRRFRVRHLWTIPGLAIAFFASAEAERRGVSLWPLLLFGILPHLPALAGIGQPHAAGQMPARALPLYNALHQPLVVLAVLAVAATGLLGPSVFVGALAWFSHIVIGWALRDGPRTADGYQMDSLPRRWFDRLTAQEREAEELARA